MIQHLTFELRHLFYIRDVLSSAVSYDGVEKDDEYHEMRHGVV